MKNLKKILKDAYSINITIVPFDSRLFQQDTSNGLYLLIDCIYKHKIMWNVGKIQNHIRISMTNKKKCNVIWSLLFLSNRQHKWEGKIT